MNEDDILRKIEVIATEIAIAALADRFNNLKHLCESPIERILLAALIAEFQDFNAVAFCTPDRYHSAIRANGHVVISPQLPIGDYRVDFAISIPLRSARITDPKQRKRKLLVIECDGHDFHERTQEQAEYDRKRDRELQSTGVRVFRFTGREIWRNPIKCAEEVGTAVRLTWGTLDGD